LSNFWPKLKFYDVVMSVYFAGWTAAADIAKRALLKFETPTKRGQTSTMVTVDQVSRISILFSITIV